MGYEGVLKYGLLGVCVMRESCIDVLTWNGQKIEQVYVTPANAAFISGLKSTSTRVVLLIHWRPFFPPCPLVLSYHAAVHKI
jgi:hypothetical protein